MSILKPHSTEDKRAYMTRCMASALMAVEFPDDAQRSTVCSYDWREFKMNPDKKKKKKTGRDLKEIEIFAVGRWNGMDFTIEDLMDFASNFHRLKENHQVPIKLGHNAEQPFTDGQPALGWVTNIYVNKSTGKLLADLEDVPDVVAEAIEAKLYKNVSIEADFGVEYKGEFFANVLSGIALLGADIPAVNTLEDLQQFMSKEQAAFTIRESRNFSAIDGNNIFKEIDMATEAELQAEIAALKSKNATLESDKKTFSTDNDVLKKKVADGEVDAKKAAFARQTDDVTKDLNDLVKAKKITPATRDDLTKDISESTIANVQFSIAHFKKLPVNTAMEDLEDEDGHGNSGDSKKGDYDDPSEEVNCRAMKFQRENANTSYSNAVRHVLGEDKTLARDYVDITGSN